MLDFYFLSYFTLHLTQQKKQTKQKKNKRNQGIEMSEIQFSPVAIEKHQCYDVIEISNDDAQVNNVTANEVTSAASVKRTE